MIVALVVIVLAVVLSAMLRVGLASLTRTTRADAFRDAAEMRPGADRIARLLDDRDIIVPSVNVTHAALMVSAGVLGSWVLARSATGTMLVAAMVAMVFALTILGDLIPRAVGRRRPRVIAYRMSPLLALAIRIGSWATDIFYDEPDDEEEEQTDHEQAGEDRLISSVLEFSETIVREVMVPRTDMVLISSGAPFGELLVLIAENGFSRIPVVGDGPDDVIGMVIAKDLIPMLASGSRPETVVEVMRRIDFVPETKRVAELLREMQASKSHLAVVVDEYGGTAGIVTIEDLLEELVGEIVDEYDDDELMIEERSDGLWAVDGRMAVEELAEIVGCELPDDEWDTVAGLVLGLAGRVPNESERFFVGDVAIKVERLQGRRVALVEVERVVASALAEDAR
ncbi:MAG: hemolysin family protein [Acidimicrobiia bacterium]